MSLNFYGCIDETLRHNPDQVLLVWPGPGSTNCRYTGRDVLQRVATISQALTERGLRPGQYALLAMPVSVDLVASLLAVMAVGAVPVLPPASASGWRPVRLARHKSIGLLLTAHPLKRPVGWLLRRLSLMPVAVSTLTTQATTDYVAPQRVDPSQPALISHSSGSTGRAKSVWRSHRVLLAQHQALKQSFPPWPRQRDFPLFPNVLLHNLATGTTSILPDITGLHLNQLAPARIIQQLVNERIETLTGNVYYFQQLLTYLTAQPQTFPAVRLVGIGGSPVPEPLLLALKPYFTEATLYVIYGSSEAEPIAVRAVDGQPGLPQAGYVVGAVHPALELRFRPLGQLTQAGGDSYSVGEIGVRGPHVVADDSGWFFTGDFGYLNEQQQLVLTGRAGNERIHQGVQHYQIEHVLAHLAGVVRVAARATDTGFSIYIQGTAPEKAILAALRATFPVTLPITIHYKTTLPVDARHQSKILYDRL